MAKTPKLRKSSKPPSLHSRASKRLTSPTLNLDKSLTSLAPPAPSPSHRPSVLAAHRGAGISKKKAKGKALSRAQRRRQERGLERAEIVMDKTERKVERGVGRRRGGRERKVAWEEFNGKLSEGRGTGMGSKRKGGALEKEKEKEKENEDGEWEDESIGEEDEVGGKVSDVPGLMAGAEATEGEKPPDQGEDEDVIL